ncbi:hypothetical protein FB451DRAFT_1391800 [Mycena latifolia]|nr:hypothetical protein FB451DRAFT_1391800 [Mycena latifolia]
MYSSDLHPPAIQLTLASLQRIASQRIAHVLTSSVVLRSQSFPALDIDPRRDIEELDTGLVTYSDQASRNTIVTLQSFPNLCVVTLYGGRVTPQVHAALAQLPKLRRLRLQKCAFQTFTRVAPPPAAPSALRELVLHNALVTDTARQPLDSLDAGTLHAHNRDLKFQLLN